MFMRNVCLRALILALTVGALAMTSRAQAQTVQTLIQFTNSWRYDQSGRNLGTNWRAINYTEDAQWQPLSPGLLGSEPDTPALYTVTAPILTTLSVSTVVTTYYFRTTFTFNGSTNGVVLWATNLVDDGCAIYLNGRLAGGVRMPAGYAGNPTTTFGGPATEGQLDIVQLTNFLRNGQNTMAVEVHQSAATSTDMMFGMKLASFSPTLLSIATQPTNQSLAVGDRLDLAVVVSGGPATYRWEKDGVPISNATNSTYSIAAPPGVTLASAGNYRVIVANVLNSVTSEVARVTVVEDTVGPKMLRAVINNTSPSGQSFGTNTINILWDENLPTSLPSTDPRSPVNTNNYRLFSSTNASIQIPILGATYNSALGVLLQVQGTNENWNPSGSYYLVVNNISDIRTNRVNPNSVIGVSTLITTNLFQMSAVWNYYDCSADFCDPDAAAVYAGENWVRTNYVIDPSTWGTGQGIFARETGTPALLCAGDEIRRFISWQLDPILFRSTFRLPTNSSIREGTLRLRFIYDDGFILYLNGRPIYSNNCVGPVSQATRAAGQAVTEAICTNASVFVSNLQPGTNWLAAALVSHAVNHEADAVFGLEMDLVTFFTAPAPTNRPPGNPTLTRSVVRNPQTNYFVLSWPPTNYGYTLQYSTNIAGTGQRPDRNWWTNNANWVQVQDQANPYTNRIPPTTGPRRFYRLYREKLND